MNKLIALTKIQLKDFMSRYVQQLNLKSKSLSKLVILLPVLILLPAFQLIGTIYDSFLMIGMPELTLTYVYVAATMLVFLMGIPLIVSVFFYAKDLTLIATLPVKEDTIVFSKLASVYVYLLAIATMIFGVGVGYYAFGDGFNLIALLLGILGILLTPLMPMIFSTILILPFMTFVGGKRNRNLMVIIGNLVMLAVIISIQVAFSRSAMDPESLQSYLSSRDGLIYLIGHRFPPSVWLTKMIAGSWQHVGLFVLLNAGFVVLLKLTAKIIYKGAVLKYNQESSGAKAGGNGKIEYKTASKRMWLIKRHLGIIFHNPTFLLNTVMTMFVPLLLFGIYTAMGLMSLETFKDPMFKPYGIYLFTGIISAPTIMGSLSATVITREGKTFWETRVLPISINENLITRILSSVILNGVASVVLAAISFWVFPVNALDILLGLLFAFAAIICFSTMDLIFNIERPYLNWSNPTAAIKNNLNIMLSLVPRLIIGFLIFGLYKVLPAVSGQFMVAIATVVMVIFFALSYMLVFGRYRLKFIDMEV